jgi:hypothetical protein
VQRPPPWRTGWRPGIPEPRTGAPLEPEQLAHGRHGFRRVPRRLSKQADEIRLVRCALALVIDPLFRVPRGNGGGLKLGNRLRDALGFRLEVIVLCQQFVPFCVQWVVSF